MNISTGNYIGHRESREGEVGFRSFSPSSNEFLAEEFAYATPSEFEHAVTLAEKAFLPYSEISYSQRAVFLETIAEEIMQLGDGLIDRCAIETGLPKGRLESERTRTCNQLRMFAGLLRDGWWLDARIDTADAGRSPIPKPDIRRMLVPIGPVAVFGASNFPLAFSTAGGDTASALAAGCPVVYKSNSSHPGTNALVASAIIKAAKACGMPDGVFSALNLTHEYATRLVEHPSVKGVGFTGSRKVGMILYYAGVNRPEPIQVFAEMSSINPVILLEDALVSQSKEIARNLAASVTLGMGQFCTNPGLILLVESKVGDRFLQDFKEAFQAIQPASMLNKNIYGSYVKGTLALRESEHTELIASSANGADPQKNEGLPMAFAVKGRSFLADESLKEEIFGPATIFVICKDAEELTAVLKSLEGQLTATIHSGGGDAVFVRSIAQLVAQKSGRVIYGGYPTGVEVCHSMQHGGPFPATSFSASTSVGSAAIVRFARPVAYQDFPDDLLPDALKNSNPLAIPRLVNGNWEQVQIEMP